MSKHIIYGDMQRELIYSQLITSGPSGIINVFYEYYLSNHPEIFKLLLQIPLNDKEVLATIQEHLDNGKYDELKVYLNNYIDTHKKSMKLNTTINTSGIDIITDYYYGFVDNDEKYRFLHTFYDNFPKTIEEAKNIVDMFKLTPIGKNPFDVANPN
jgi:hypothetical protein